MVDAEVEVAELAVGKLELELEVLGLEARVCEVLVEQLAVDGGQFASDGLVEDLL